MSTQLDDAVIEKRKAYRFLKGLQGFLNYELPPPKTMRKEITTIVERAKQSREDRHMAFPEGAFLNYYIAPLLHKYLLGLPDMSHEKAREALLSESYRRIPEFASDSPSRKIGHPFKKVLGASPKQILRQWKGELQGSPLVQSCPDLALRPPSPFKILFEGKYFSKGGIGAAETALATDIYQAFFYLGLPYVPPSKGPAWDYDYACVLSYDATDSGSLAKAWENMTQEVRKGFWEGANIYVMVLRGRV